MRAYLTALAFLVAAAPLVRADEKKDEPKANLTVTATLVAKTTTYKLDLGGKTADDFKKELKDAEKSGKVPVTPTVEMTLELKNTGDKDVQVWVSGDPVVVMLDLKGPGAVSIKPQLAFTTIFIGPKAVTIAPGKTHAISVTSLKYGFRNASHMAYWTEPGEYTLMASLRTGISPVPKGSKETRDGFGEVTLTAEPVKIKVEAK
jgi:hypothetical protein